MKPVRSPKKGQAPFYEEWMLIGGIDEAGSKPKKGTGTFYYFSQQF